ncbi:acyl-CoA reductase [Aureispira anguillae]|uniref:Acyl-CoA reductase n=1 Tax=Aureispira anguillae TaxID=2864201 RepID=A0A916DVD1_9BACT|nr:acyl-CoA reductase [Aureispira anguillae]BDS13420.1 acyl-CoA reductase [Aureispira anguillae]
MTLQERLALLVKLGAYLQEDTEERQLAIAYTERYNRWLTKANSLKALESFATTFLAPQQLEAWVANYPLLKETTTAQKVGLVLAGNIPAVGFHDVMATFVAGHQAIIKYSDKDQHLIPYMVAYLIQEDERCADYFVRVPMLKNFDAVIATGSNNSAMYFEQYFGKYPNIIRKNRNSIAVLDGSETDEELLALGVDIFRYFGLGCRSISKLYVPEGYDFPRLLGLMDNYKDIMDHNKYKNNYDYNRSIYLLNKVPHLANDCLMVVEHESLLSRISSIHFEYYQGVEDLEAKLNDKEPEIQCIASKMNLPQKNTVNLGQAQSPKLMDYADGVDTLQFLIEL